MTTVIERTTKSEQKLASKTIESMSESVALTSQKGKKKSPIKIKVEGIPDFIEIPNKAFSMLLTIIKNMSEGKSFTLISSESEISTQQAADLLNLSRPYVVKLLEEGQIPHKKVGRHRRILLEDILKYDLKQRKKNDLLLDELVKESQILYKGYE